MKPSRLLAGLLVLTLVVVTIGIAFPPTTPSDVGGTQSYVDEPVQVEGGEIDANQTALWGWTQRAMAQNVDATPTIVIQDFGSMGGGTAVQTQATEFQRLMVYDDPDQQPPGGVLAFVTAFSTDVNVNADLLPAVRNGTSGRTVEGLLVHEYAHVVQFQTPAFGENQLVAISATSDERAAYTAMVEGGAEFVADAYTNDSAVERVREYWNDPSTSAAARYGQWPYYRGLVYLDQRLDDPEQLWDIYRDRPQASATILRGEAPGDGPPNRSISMELGGYHTEVRDRPGAMLAEIALTREIDPERARTIAAGWQWGALRSVQLDGGAETDRSLRHVWVTEWRSESAAEEFESAMTEYLDGRWTAENGTWDAGDGPSFELERVDDDAVALLVGPESFLAEATVTVDGDEYTIQETAGGAAARVSASFGSTAVHGGARVGAGA